MPVQIVRIPTLKTAADFRRHLQQLGLSLPCDESILTGSDSPLSKPVASTTINGKYIGNRVAIQPMEGWDATSTGGVTEEVVRRWRRFGESGAKLIWGGEAMAVRPDGRANPNQLILGEANKAGIADLRATLVTAHRDRHGNTDDLVIGFQLTHSGRFCKPHDKFKLEPRVACRHPILDRCFNVTDDSQVWTDDELDRLITDYVRAARVAWEAGADFVDLKHCHGYLLHELLGAHSRPGRFGGAFDNRTRFLREVIAGIRADANPIEIGVRLSAFDLVPYRPDPDQSQPGRPRPGIPEDYLQCLPYRFGFGVNPDNPLEYDLTETHQFIELCASLGVKALNFTAGSPYYNPHIQRPAIYPPSDGYQPPEDPLVGVARQIEAVQRLKARAPANLLVVGSAYSYLQEYLPQVAQAVVRAGWTDLVGLGRVALSYPTMLSDAVLKGALATKAICRTFSDCTTAPRNGLISGCYPLDSYYAARPEAKLLKGVKKNRARAAP